MAKIKRSEFATFLNTGASSSATWSRMGKGITSQVVAYNPQTTTETYIDEDNATTNVDSYQIQIDSPMTAYSGDPVFDYVDALRKKHALGSELETEVLLVNIYDKTGSSYSAEKCKAIIVINEFGGEGGGNVQLSFAIQINGDPVLGTCTITEGVPTFSPATA